MLFPGLFDTLYRLLIDPNVVFLLFVVAMVGIYLEIAHPGAILPGGVGGIALLLFLCACSALTLNWLGLSLMVLAFVLLVLDLRLPTHGVLTLGAIVSLVWGAFLFLQDVHTQGGERINPLVVYTMAALLGLISFYLVGVIMRSRGRPVAASNSPMLGASVTALTPLLPAGRVALGGEDWEAMLEDPSSSVDAGTELRIVALEGLRLHVAPLRREVDVDGITQHPSRE
jgi:membrane-bound serine protease (ClpP class)